MTVERHIKRLPADTTGKIAAGEVIERPVNAVKELLENALDASASRVSISVEEGGRRSIRVEDDGTGIPAAELALAAENYSTSKIGLISDLDRITTLGFRGEALASIRAVARLTIRSRDASEEIGREIRWRGEEVLGDEPAVMKPGTTVIVEDLFHNLPARKKFLSSDASEIRRITSLVQSYALAWPEVSLSLSHNGREILSYPSCSFAERVEMVFGSSVFPGLRAFEGSDGGMRVRGYTTLPSVTRGNRSMQFLFVNGRLVRDRLLGHAVRQAYHSLIPGDRFPMTV
ncbi:MAG: DNA mismatch repair endonuclease MutL, partial [Candidatus Krumholzibacteria bacterium]|nr:DNA mismatch repair endonuclease MutL [Candidatus Krumholzibacteria bacterium]